MKRILLSLASIGAVAAIAIIGTGAFFSDTETSEDNLFQAGGIDLLVDSQSHYAGMVCNDNKVWEDEGNQSIDPQNPDTSTRPELLGTECTGTWESTNLNTLTNSAFFSFFDLKPGDEGENTISLTVEDNDAYMCAIIDNMHDDDRGLTEPEQEDGDLSDGPDNGELSPELHFFAWADDGDNIWDSGEPELFSNTEGPASDVLGGVSYAMYTPDTGAFVGGTTGYIGMYWCYGDITVNALDNTLSCDGSAVTNLSQTDQLTADISFYVEQARNNDDFVCPQPDNQDRAFVGTALGAYDAPEACNLTVGPAQTHTTIGSALAAATTGQTICVEDGTYSETVDITTNGLTLASVNGPTNTATIDGGVIVDATDVTVTGFIVIPGNTEGSTSGFYLKEPADNVEISYNEIDASSVADARGVVNVIGSTVDSAWIHHNYIHGDGSTGSGIYTNPHTGALWTIEYNDIDNFLAGIGQWNGANVMYNEFDHSVAASEAIGVDNAWDANGGSVNFNNFLNGTMLKTYTSIAGTIDAENNYFSIDGDTQVDDTNGTVDYDPEAGSAFLHN